MLSLLSDEKPKVLSYPSFYWDIYPMNKGIYHEPIRGHTNIRNTEY